MTTSVQFVGSGDAFGSGGRLQTCVLVRSPELIFTLDFGASSLAGLRQQRVDPNSIDAILITHFHGDHCGGVPFFLLDAMLASKRTAPLTIAGPPALATHLTRLQDALFPGSHVMAPSFPVSYVEIGVDEATSLGPLKISAIPARHTHQTNPLALKIEVVGKTIAFTGDGEYTDELASFVVGADLLIAECYAYSKPIRWHMNYPDISRLAAKKIVLTHMNEEMLLHQEEVPELCAYDGLTVEV